MMDQYESVGYGGISDGLGTKPAVLVVDMQVGFTDPKFPLGGLPMVHAATEKISELLQVARAHHVPVAKCYTAYGSTADMPRWKIQAVRDEFIHGHPCTALDPRVHDAEYDFTFCKTAPSIFLFDAVDHVSDEAARRYGDHHRLHHLRLRPRVHHRCILPWLSRGGSGGLLWRRRAPAARGQSARLCASLLRGVGFEGDAAYLQQVD